MAMLTLFILHNLINLGWYKNLFKGRLRDIAAELINISSSSAAKLESINNNLSEDLKEEFKENKINTAQAYALSQKTEEEQKEKLEEYKMIQYNYLFDKENRLDRHF